MRVVVLGTRGLPNLLGGVEKHCAELSSALVSSYSRGITEAEKKEYTSSLRSDYNWDEVALRTLEVYKEAVG